MSIHSRNCSSSASSLDARSTSWVVIALGVELIATNLTCSSAILLNSDCCAMSTFGSLDSGSATGVTLGSTCSVICVSFILPSPENTSGNSWRNCSAWLVTAPTSIPAFNIPSFVVVCFPNSGTPLPFTTTNSAFSLPFPARTSHSNVPFISSGLSERPLKILRTPCKNAFRIDYSLFSDSIIRIMNALIFDRYLANCSYYYYSNIIRSWCWFWRR